MTISVAQLSPHASVNLGTGDDDTHHLVNERFGMATDYATESFDSAQDYLDALGRIFTDAVMPEISATYDEQMLTLEPDMPAVPEPPTAEQLTVGDIPIPEEPASSAAVGIPDVLTNAVSTTEPVRPSIGSITVPTVTVPSFADLNVADTSLNYTEVPFASALTSALESSLLNWVTTGGTGLDEDVEEALWVRARARKDTENLRMYDEAENYFAARGFSLPPGALAGRLTEAGKEIARADQQINYEIMIEQARLAQNNTQFAHTIGLQLEGQEKELWNNAANRAFEAAKAAIQVIIDIFNAKVQERMLLLEAIKTEAEVANLQVTAQAEANKSAVLVYQTDVDRYKADISKRGIAVDKYQVDIARYKASLDGSAADVELYKANIEKYKADLQKELGFIEQLAKIYSYKVGGYEAEAKLAISHLDAQIREFLGRVEQEKAQTELSLKEAEMTLTSYLSSLGLNIEATKAAANIISQIAASALSGISVGAHLSDGYSRGVSKGYSFGESISNSASISQSITE